MFGRSLNKYTSNERKPVQIFPWVDKKKQVSILPTSETVFFWNISFDVFTSDLAPSRMIFGKRWPFLVTKSSTFKEAKRLYFFVTLEFFVSITFATELVHRSKKNEASTHCCFEKQTLKMTVERRQNHLRQSQLIFQKTFRTLSQKWRNFEGCLFFLLWVEAQNEIGRNSFRNDWC